jgi:hypothetical protein
MDLGIVLVMGRSLFPKPAASINPFKAETSVFSVFSRLIAGMHIE